MTSAFFHRQGTVEVLRKLGILCVALLTTSCATIGPRFQELQIPPARIVQQGYSLVPLNEKGWLIGGRDAIQVLLMKLGEHPDETFITHATLIHLPAFTTDGELVDLVKKGEDDDTDPHRFNTTIHEVTVYPKPGAVCTQSHMVSEDRGAVKRSRQTENMILEVLVLTCAHPSDKRVGVSVAYSQRHYPGQGDPAFFEKATRILNSVKLTAP